jgi:hypothetical protein
MTRGEMEEVKRHFDAVAEGLRSDFRGEMTDVKRHFEVVAEGLRSDIRIVAEGHVALQRSLDAIRMDLGLLRSDFESFRLDMYAFRSEMNRRLGALESRPN